MGFLVACVPTDGWKRVSVGTQVGASGFEPLASRTRTVRSIRAELRPASHDYTTAPPFYKQKFFRLQYNSPNGSAYEPA